MAHLPKTMRFRIYRQGKSSKYLFSPENLFCNSRARKKEWNFIIGLIKIFPYDDKPVILKIFNCGISIHMCDGNQGWCAGNTLTLSMHTGTLRQIVQFFWCIINKKIRCVWPSLACQSSENTVLCQCWFRDAVESEKTQK
jgi:hypothetical protein